MKKTITGFWIQLYQNAPADAFCFREVFDQTLLKEYLINPKIYEVSYICTPRI